jgi:hypothetical protein
MLVRKTEINVRNRDSCSNKAIARTLMGAPSTHAIGSVICTPGVDAPEARTRLVENFVPAVRASERITASWTEHIRPVARWAAGVILAVIVVLVLAHAPMFHGYLALR